MENISLHLIDDVGDLVFLAIFFLVFLVIFFVRKGEKRIRNKEGADLEHGKRIDVHTNKKLDIL